MTEVEAAKLVTMLITAWPEGMRWLNADEQANTRQLYRDFLSDLPYQAGDAAVRRLIATWKPTSAQRWPSIAELRGQIMTQLHGRALTGGQAWGQVRKLIAKHGAHRTPGIDFVIDDPIVAQVVEAMGWSELCQSEMSVADRARSIELCEQLSGFEVADRTVGLMAPPIAPRARLRKPDEPQAMLVGDVLKELLPGGK